MTEKCVLAAIENIFQMEGAHHVSHMRICEVTLFNRHNVYRALLTLERFGLMRERAKGNGQRARYELSDMGRAWLDHHPCVELACPARELRPLPCMKCGEVFESSGPENRMCDPCRAEG
jgi:Fe2+ or Zn2+ uptake regulation protein